MVYKEFVVLLESNDNVCWKPMPHEIRQFQRVTAFETHLFHITGSCFMSISSLLLQKCKISQMETVLINQNLGLKVHARLILDE